MSSILIRIPEFPRVRPCSSPLLQGERATPSLSPGLGGSWFSSEKVGPLQRASLSSATTGDRIRRKSEILGDIGDEQEADFFFPKGAKGYREESGLSWKGQSVEN